MRSFGQPHPRLSLLQLKTAAFLPTSCTFPDRVPLEHRFATKSRKLLVGKAFTGKLRRNVKAGPDELLRTPRPDVSQAMFHLENEYHRFLALLRWRKWRNSSPPLKRSNNLRLWTQALGLSTNASSSHLPCVLISISRPEITYDRLHSPVRNC